MTRVSDFTASVFIALSLVWGCSGDLFVTSRSDVDKANALLQSEAFTKALEAYADLDSEDGRIRIEFNRGLAYARLGEWKKAIDAFSAVRESKDPGMKAASYYETGNVHMRSGLAAELAKKTKEASKAWGAAASAYESALFLQPEHALARRQLEVALLWADPPCDLPEEMRTVTLDGNELTIKPRNDDAEPNNNAGASAELTLEAAQGSASATGEKQVKKAFWLCPDDQDWFTVKMETGDRLTSTVKREKGPEFAAPFLELWTPDGSKRLLPSSDDADSSAEVREFKAEGSGDFRVRVINPGKDDFGYTLETKVRPACSRTEDKEFEPNDSLTWAKPVKNGDLGPLRLCPANEDWFGVELKEGQSLKVTVQSEEVQAGTIKLDLVDTEGTSVREGAKDDKEAGNEALVALAYARPAGKVLVRVYGTDDVEAVYKLKIEVIDVCAEREDAREENDDPAGAQELAVGEHENLQLCPKDPDYYKVSVKAGESIAAHLQAEPLMGKPTIEVLTADGSKVIGRGFPLEGSLLALALDPGPGDYLVKVDGTPNADSKYDLKLEVLPPCPKGDDRDEENDKPADATLLEPPKQEQAGAAPGAPPGQGGSQQPPKPKRKLLRLCPGDVDWYRIPVSPETQPMIAQIDFIHDKGDLDMMLYEADGETRIDTSDRSSTERQLEQLTVPPPRMPIPNATDFLLRIAGHDKEAQNFYLLSLRPAPNTQNQNKQQQPKPNPEPKDNKNEQQKKQQDQSLKALEREMESDDKNERNLQAERAKRRARHEAPPDKDW